MKAKGKNKDRLSLENGNEYGVPPGSPLKNSGERSFLGKLKGNSYLQIA